MCQYQFVQVFLSVIRSYEVSAIRRVSLYQLYRKIGRCKGQASVRRRCPLFGVSDIGGSTVLAINTTHKRPYLDFHKKIVVIIWIHPHLIHLCPRSSKRLLPIVIYLTISSRCTELHMLAEYCFGAHSLECRQSIIDYTSSTFLNATQSSGHSVPSSFSAKE